MFEFGQFALAAQGFDVSFDGGDACGGAVFVEVLPCGVGDGAGQFESCVVAFDGVERVLVGVLGVVFGCVCLFEACLEFVQVGFGDEADGLSAVFDAVLAAVRGFELSVALDLAVFAVGVVDGFDA